MQCPFSSVFSNSPAHLRIIVRSPTDNTDNPASYRQLASTPVDVFTQHLPVAAQWSRDDNRCNGVRCMSHVINIRDLNIRNMALL
jgi:hypothetical protein